MTISFHTRLFAVAALIVGAVLAAVTTLGWSGVLKVEVERLDDRLCMEARRVATQPVLADDLPRLEADVALKLRLGSAEQLMLRVDAADGAAGVQSLRWRDVPPADDLRWDPSRLRSEPGLPPGRAPAPPPDSPPPTGAPSRLEGKQPGGEQPGGERPEGPRPPGPPPGLCSLASFTSAGSEWRAARFELPGDPRPDPNAEPRPGPGVGHSVIAANMASVKAELQTAVQRALRLVIPLALLLTALGAWLLATLSLRPVKRLRTAMKGMTPQAPDQRLPSAGEDREVKALIGDYNTMLARLEASFHQASRFSADAAHGLRTPLTILQGRIEQAVGRSANRAVQGDLTDMLNEVGRLTGIARKLLLLSQADAGRLALSLTRIDLTELLDALVSDAQMLVTHQTLAATIERHLVTQGDALLLRQLVNNLVSNAVRYCRPGGRIEVHSRRVAGGIETGFVNDTPAIPAGVRARFFERFFRGDPAHHRSVEGSGLGLSLAREIARAHGGDLTLESGVPDEVRLRLWLPGS